MAQATAPSGSSRPRRAQRIPVRTTVLAVLSFVVVGVFVAGSWRTLTLKPGGITGGTWRQLLVTGIARGSIYSLIALGYSLVYGILLMINFAHGEVFMSGAFASFFVAETLDHSGFLNRNPAVALLVLFLVAMAVSTMIALLLERVAYRPLRNSPRLVPLITAIGASLFLQYTLRGFFGEQIRGYPDVKVLRGAYRVAGFEIGRTELLVFAVALASMVALGMFVSRTRTGKAMRATSQDREIARLMGIDVDRTVVATFALGGIMAGIAGVLFALQFGFVQFNMGFVPGIKAFTAAVLGGIGSIAGAAIGGFLLGLVEALAPVLLFTGIHVAPNQLTDVVAFTILVLVLIFRPGGILGTGEPEKV